LQADKKGPEFASVYNKTEQQIMVQFSALEVLLHQEAILNIKDFAETLVERIEAAKLSEEKSDEEKVELDTNDGGKTEATKEVVPARRKSKKYNNKTTRV
jgi:vacuolar protein sorting-associated protein 13A/C